MKMDSNTKWPKWTYPEPTEKRQAMNIHNSYGGNPQTDELIPGEISDRGTLTKWRQNGVILACLRSGGYAYDPELKIIESNVTDITHVIWDDTRRTYSGRGAWRYLSLSKTF